MRGGLRNHGFMVGLCSAHFRIGRALKIIFDLSLLNLFLILDGDFAWQQYLVCIVNSVRCMSGLIMRVMLCGRGQYLVSFNNVMYFEMRDKIILE